MYCSRCGGGLEAMDNACGTCGTVVRGSGTSGQERLAATLDDTRQAWRAMIRDPTGGLAAVMAELGPDRTFVVGGAFSLLFALVVAMSVRGASTALSGFFAVPLLPLLIGAAVFPVGIAGVCAVARVATRIEGTFGADLFTASAAVLPIAAATAAVGLVGVTRFVVAGAVSFVGISTATMLLFAGAARISKFSERFALLVVPASMLIAGWGAMVVTRGLL